MKHVWHIQYDTTKDEVLPCRLNSCQAREAQEMLTVIPEDRSKDEWIVGSVEAGVGRIRITRVHRHGEGVGPQNVTFPKT